VISHEEMYEIFRPLIISSKLEDSIDILKKLVELWPDFSVAHNDLGVLYYNAGEKEKALIHYQEATRLQPENITFQKNLADFYYVEECRIEDALRIYVKILESYPKDIETLLATAHICGSLRKIDDAKVFYNRVLEIEPWNSVARQKLESI
jgi:tetratricopeptide (TPR) repeat protein